jgi:hypothetical protein
MSDMAANNVSLRFLDKVTRLFSTVSAKDKGFKFCVYGFKVLEWMIQSRQHREVLAGVGAIVSKMSDARYALRLYGLADYLHWLLLGIDGKDDTKSDFDRAQALSMVLFQGSEYVWWFGSLAPQLVPVDVMRWCRASCFFWLLYLALDFFKLIYQMRKLSMQLHALETKISTNTDKLIETQSQRENLTSSLKSLKIQFLLSALDFPLCVHWSFDRREPLLSNTQVGILGLVGAIVSLSARWRTL